MAKIKSGKMRLVKCTSNRLFESFVCDGSRSSLDFGKCSFYFSLYLFTVRLFSFKPEPIPKFDRGVLKHRWSSAHGPVPEARAPRVILKL
jgi:hypothetical protein